MLVYQRVSTYFSGVCPKSPGAASHRVEADSLKVVKGVSSASPQTDNGATVCRNGRDIFTPQLMVIYSFPECIRYLIKGSNILYVLCIPYLGGSPIYWDFTNLRWFNQDVSPTMNHLTNYYRVNCHPDDDLMGFNQQEWRSMFLTRNGVKIYREGLDLATKSQVSCRFSFSQSNDQ